MVKKYRKLPVVIEAVQWTGENWRELGDFIECIHALLPDKGEIDISTLEGIITASKGDYIIKGISGEFYPCKPDIFAKTYEAVE